jgi:hypothetical protein
MPTRFVTAVQQNIALEGAASNGATGIQGSSDSGPGVNGQSTTGVGVKGSSISGTAGVYGTSAASGVMGETTSTVVTDSGVLGHNPGPGVGVTGYSASGFGVVGHTDSGSAGVSGFGPNNGVSGQTGNATSSGVLGQNSGNGSGVSGSSQGGIGVSGSSQSGFGLYGTSNSNSAAFLEITAAANSLPALEVKTLAGTGVDATSKDGIGIAGHSTNNIGVSGSSQNSPGVVGSSQSDIGVSGNSQGGTGVQGQSTNGFAGKFIGNVDVQGTFTKSAGSFKIDHPLYPAHKYLIHAFVESAEMKNIYDGTIALNAYGEATVDLPTWFEALNCDFRYQLTCIGGYAPIYIASEIQERQFKIAGGKAGMKVSWQVTGVRHDPYAQAHPLIVEQDKTGQELGSYRHPELYDEVQIQEAVYMPQVQPA